MFFQYLQMLWKSLIRKSIRVFLTENKYELLDSKAGNFSMITYNIAGLPQGISAAKTERSTSIEVIGARLNDFDIINIQEDFNYNNQLYQGGNQHHYRSISMGLAIFGDGLDTLSKYPLSNFRRMKWLNRTGSDRLTPKGFTHCSLHLAKGVEIDLYNIHANSQDHIRAAKARRANFNQLATYMRTHSRGKAIILAGDFNAHFDYVEDNLPDFIRETQLTDSWVFLQHDQVIPNIDPRFLCLDSMDIDNESESIDKIMFRSSKEITLIPKNYQVEKKKFVDDQKIPLSDHWPIRVIFDWKLNDSSKV
ncbi:endonuclease/exonuclease/phosphatase family protein [Sphingobacterium sp. SRCM116780]|uniref:endonuclease/exonuclease/phosphatase family protein n=1 Tax=Sphingobacterium sp. SRCM116780 TaxID=2907623 RepID=UPI001F16EE6A|nr:endonuclease/exonuclease/phosphatase family protein [Sphingobacterium sp. SRCM116780]UIR57079.1 endonuclease/exonuclease/phosphatase family protein [Sphingobacterium sp. SRCM116780]